MTLMILAHPNMQQSIANKTIVESLRENVPSIEYRDIHQLYPNYQINVAEEQNALLRHNLIILQYPMYWFNMPAILKIWFDEVFTYNFAYGSKGDKLKGKKVLPSLTIGQPEQNFQKEGHHAIYDFLSPVKQSLTYAKMDYIEPILLYGVSTISGYTPEQIKEKSIKHSLELKQAIIEHGND